MGFFSVTNLVVFFVGFLLLIAWLICFSQGMKYATLFDTLSEKEYPLKEIYFVGYNLLEKVNYKYRGKKNRILKKEVEVLYGEKYSDYYLRVIHAQKITISFTILILSFALYGVGNEISLLVIGIAFAGLAFYYFGNTTSKKIEKRSEEFLFDFSEVVSKLALMTNAGMILREAWEQIAYSGETVFYKEMQIAVDDMRNGVSETDALFKFGLRSMVPEIKKFSSTLIQGLVKGNAELTIMLQSQSNEIWGLKKQDVKRQGEKAASKLLIPMVIMFVGILIMILVPIFSNLGV